MAELTEHEAKVLAAVMVGLAEAGVPTDVQGLLCEGDPRRGIAPNAMRKALAAPLAELRAALDALRWFDYRRAPLQSKFDLHGPADTAAALRDQLARVRALLAGVPLAPRLRSIEDADKDGTRILAKFHDDLFPRIKPGRDDLAPWNGAWAVIRHRGLASDGWDPGWNVAAPVGRGGFPDEWLEGWLPIPATAP